MRNKLNKIKLFSDENIADLEKKINLWFKQNKFIEIVQILQSETVTNIKSDSMNGSFNRTITVCYKDTETPSLEMNETIVKEKASKKAKPSPAVSEPVEIPEVSKNHDDLEDLYKRLQE
jgi:hypothetical protein